MRPLNCGMTILIVAQATGGAMCNWRKNIMPVAESGPLKDPIFGVRERMRLPRIGSDITQNQITPETLCTCHFTLILLSNCRAPPIVTYTRGL